MRSGKNRTEGISKIQKRDGRIVNFDSDKIVQAIKKAFEAANERNGEAAKKLAEEVVELVEERIKGIPRVEDVQDLVEEVLIKHGYARVAKKYILYRHERAELREAKEFFGVVDDLKLGINAIKVLERRYLLRDENFNIIETPSGMFRRVARTIAAVDRVYDPGRDVAKVEDEFYNVMANLEFLPNSPTLMNAGTEVGQLSACFVLPIEDSVESIFDALKHMALIHQSGGGTGFSFSRIRPKGDVVKSTMGVASGPLSFMRAFDMATEIIKQGGKRRGANMGILRVDHPDILEFIPAKGEEGFLTNFNVSVAVTDAFMEAVEKDEEYPLINPRNGKVVKTLRARDVFDLIVVSAWRTGDPGLIFIDEINKHNPTPHLGEIESTNPCVAAGTLVTTSRGLMKIEDVVSALENGEALNVFVDARVGSPISPHPPGNGGLILLGTQLGRLRSAWYSGVKETVKITTKMGYEIICTPDHRFLTPEGGWVAARELEGRRILLQSGGCNFESSPFISVRIYDSYSMAPASNLPTKWSKDLGRVLGWLIGSGWISAAAGKYEVGFVFKREDRENMEKITSIVNFWLSQTAEPVEGIDGRWKLSFQSKVLYKFFKGLGCYADKSENRRVPSSLFTAPKEAVEGFLEYLFSSSALVSFSGMERGSLRLKLSSASKHLLKDVQSILLGIFGVKSSISTSKSCKEPSTVRSSPSAPESCGIGIGFPCYTLEISDTDLLKFLDAIKITGRLAELKEALPRETQGRRDKPEDEVISVVPYGRMPVYDLAEDLSNTFLANGIVVHNCAEQPLLPYESCNLGSINLAKMISRYRGEAEIDYDKLEKTVKTAVHFLDNVIDANKFPLKKIEEVTKGNRKIGLGVMGFAYALLELGIPYDSKEALKKAEEIMGFISRKAREASVELAQERGVFPNYEGSVWEEQGLEVRNASVTTIAPTGTLSIIAGTSSSIEPIFAVSFYRSVMGGTRLLEVNPIFERIARERRFYSRSLLRRIAMVGSIRGMREIPEDVRRIFVTALEVPPEMHVRMQAAFQRHVDSAVSKTVNLPSDASLGDVKKVFLLAYKLKCKGITIYRYGSKPRQVLYIGPVSEAAGRPSGKSCATPISGEECIL